MAQNQDPGPGSHCVLIFMLGVFLLASPFSTWWMTTVAPWYFPFVLWLLLIILSAALARRLIKRHDA